MKQYMKSHGEKLFGMGYSLTPITTIDWTVPVRGTDERKIHPAAGKAPVFRGWANQAVTAEDVAEWVSKKGIRRCGVGIRTWNNPAVDIDCVEEDASKHMRLFVEELVGFAPARVGRKPKVLLLYRTDEPFTKVKSKTWLDEWGGKNAVEILGAGQQFVAYGVHPGTKKPYEWISHDDPTNTDARTDLEVITLHQARTIVDEMDRYAEAAGWELVEKERPTRGGLASGEEVVEDLGEDEDDWVDADDVKEKWSGTLEELEALMADLPPAEDYNEWFPVLAALKDAENEVDEFKEVAREWSARASNYDDSYFETKWEQGSFNRAGTHAFTIKSITRKVEDVKMEDDVLSRLVPAFEQAENLKEWDLAAMRLRETPVWGTIRDFAVEVACAAYKSITGIKIPPATKKAALSVDHTQFDPPPWVEPWVFAETENAFVHKRTLARVVPHAFNNANAQHTIHLGVTPEMYATALRPVPVVYATMYLPSHHGAMKDKWSPVRGAEGEEFFYFNGHTWLNTFKPDTIPPVAESISKKGQIAVGIVDDFFKTQFTDPDEYRHFMDWIAWVINNPTKRMTYALLILGGQGSGKSIIKKFMSYMLGQENVGTVNNQVIHKSFTGWQAGQLLKVIEEISVSGHRYDVMNSLKEPITNERLFIERKNREGVEEVNTASWMMYTNDTAALPIDKGDRRFLVVESAFKHKGEVAKFLEARPDFFKRFEKAFTKYASEIRAWFAGWEYSPEFSHSRGIAPSTSASGGMVQAAQDDFTMFVSDALEAGDVAGVDRLAIHSAYLNMALPKDTKVSNRFVSSRLSSLGFYQPGGRRVQLRVNGVRGSVFIADSPATEHWINADGSAKTELIKEYLEKQTDEMEARDVADTWQ